MSSLEADGHQLPRADGVGHVHENAAVQDAAGSRGQGGGGGRGDISEFVLPEASLWIRGHCPRIMITLGGVSLGHSTDTLSPEGHHLGGSTGICAPIQESFYLGTILRAQRHQWGHWPGPMCGGTRGQMLASGLWSYPDPLSDRVIFLQSQLSGNQVRTGRSSRKMSSKSLSSSTARRGHGAGVSFVSPPWPT